MNELQNKLFEEDFAYPNGRAVRDTTISEDRTALQHWKIVNRMLHDVSIAHPLIFLFGHHYPVPFLLAPIGVLGLSHSNLENFE